MRKAIQKIGVQKIMERAKSNLVFVLMIAIFSGTGLYFVYQNFIQGYKEIRKFDNEEKEIIIDFVFITAIERISSCIFYFDEYRNKEHWKNETNYYLAKYKKLRNLRGTM